MRFSWEWLLDHLELDIEAEQAADRLSMHGLTVDEVFEEAGDTVLDIDITTNRPDAMNIRGIARELAAVTGAGLLPLDTAFDETAEPASEYCSVRIDDPQGCHRFCARVIKGVSIGPSPDWMARRLESIGMRSLNLLVDITNYVLWELGHPLHGYDLALVPEGKIVVRRAGSGERLMMIDGSERILDPSILVIADEKRAIGIGGVMGGGDTEINDNTVDILLEGAYFEPALIRRGSKKLELSTEASYRFERGADINGMAQAIDRCCNLYANLAGGSICKGMVDTFPTPHDQVTVEMDRLRLCSFAGLQIPNKQIKDIFSSLELPAEPSADKWTVKVPSRRVDLEREADLFEEVIRIVGYDNIPSTLPHVDVSPAPPLKLHGIVDAVEGIALSAGYNEVWNYDFIDPTENALFAPEDAGEPIQVLNPIAAPQMTVMRQSLVPSLMKNIQRNLNRGIYGLRLFEVARVFTAGADGPVERTVAGFAAEPSEPPPFWHSQQKRADFFELKGVIELIFTRLGLHDIIISEGKVGFLEPAECADVSYRGKPVGWFGKIGPVTLAHYDFQEAPLIGQLDLEAIGEDALAQPRFRRWSRYPSVSRDISFALPGNLTFDKIRDAVAGAGVDELIEIRLIDLYRGEATSGRTGVTVRVVYQSNEHTLTQDDVEVLHGKIYKSLQKLGVEFR